MTELLKGKPFVDSIIEDLAARSEALRTEGIVPTLAVVRVGAKPEDLAYERGLKKRAEAAGVDVRICEISDGISQSGFETSVAELSTDKSVHGILIFEPLPEHLNADKVHKSLASEKDVDGVTIGSMATVYNGHGRGFAPCTAEGCVELLKFYGVELKGRNVAVMGRSTVIGKPVSMLLLNENATVTICHSKTENAAEICRNADIIIACIGKGKFIGADYMREGQVIVDVGINFDEEGNMTGDVDIEAAERIGVKAITPVPGGVGVCTTAVLMQHIVVAAENQRLLTK